MSSDDNSLRRKIDAPDSAKQGKEEDKQYSAVLQKIKRNQLYERTSRQPGKIGNLAKSDTKQHDTPMQGEFEEWSYRRRAPAGSHTARPCFVGEPIRTRSGSQHPVKKITFRIVTRDQGFILSSAIESKWWYFVGVIPAGQNATSLPLEDKENTDDYLVDDGNSAVKNMVRGRYLIANQYARYDGDDITIIWSFDSWDKEQAEWVQALEIGDRIVVKPYGNFEGWQSRIGSISVTLHNALVL